MSVICKRPVKPEDGFDAVEAEDEPEDEEDEDDEDDVETVKAQTLSTMRSTEQSDIEYIKSTYHADVGAIAYITECMSMMVEMSIKIDRKDMMGALYNAPPALVIDMCKHPVLIKEIDKVSKDYIVGRNFVDYDVLYAMCCVSIHLSVRTIIKSTISNNHNGEQMLIKLIDDGCVTVCPDIFKHMGNCSAGFIGFVIDEYNMTISDNNYEIVRHVVKGAKDLFAKCLMFIDHKVPIDSCKFAMIRAMLHRIMLCRSLTDDKAIHLIEGLRMICTNPNFNGLEITSLLNTLSISELNVLKSVVKYDLS
jgi:hypothetical protein